MKSRSHPSRVIAVSLVLASLGCQPLQRMGASAIVAAPNQGQPAPDVAQDEVTVEVGPPSATLSLEVAEPGGSESQGTVFVLHGIRSDRTAMRGWGRMLAQAGFRAVLVDLRGHGRSTGDWLSYGVVESRDLMQALDELERRGRVSGPIGVMGISYGAATAIEWAGKDPRVRAVVAVAPFSSLREVVPEYSPLPLPASFLDETLELAGREGGFDPHDASPVAAMSRTTARVLLLHGAADGKIPSSHSRRIYEAGRDHGELVVVPGAGHLSMLHDPAVTARAPIWFSHYLALAPEARARDAE